MAMPKTTIHENSSSIFSQHQVRMTRQARMIQPITESPGKEVFPHQHLGFCVPTSDGSHATMTLLFSHSVHSCYFLNAKGFTINSSLLFTIIYILSTNVSSPSWDDKSAYEAQPNASPWQCVVSCPDDNSEQGIVCKFLSVRQTCICPVVAKHSQAFPDIPDKDCHSLHDVGNKVVSSVPPSVFLLQFVPSIIIYVMQR